LLDFRSALAERFNHAWVKEAWSGDGRFGKCGFFCRLDQSGGCITDTWYARWHTEKKQALFEFALGAPDRVCVEPCPRTLSRYPSNPRTHATNFRHIR